MCMQSTQNLKYGSTKLSIDGLSLTSCDRLRIIIIIIIIIIIVIIISTPSEHVYSVEVYPYRASIGGFC